MSDLEVHSLPLVARNPYNFALVQPGVTGIENVEFGVPRLQVNGAPMRINYQIDGNTNTEKDRAGLRLLPMSEVMIQEVKVVTTGLRSRVRPDDGHGVQRRDQVGFKRLPR